VKREQGIGYSVQPMRSFLLSLFVASAAIGVLGSAAFGQGTTAQIKYKPAVPYPDEAKETHLEGTVSVPIVVGRSGKVSSVGEPEGPNGICPRVSTPDVKAMRSLAAKAAEKTLIDPSTLQGDTGDWHFVMNFYFKDPTAPTVTEKPEPRKDTYSQTGARMIGPGEAVLPAEPGQVPKIVRGGVLNGRAKKLPMPQYPPASHMAGHSGAVNVQVVIDEKGKVYSAIQINGYPDLGAVSRIAACESEFTPTLLSVQPVKVSGVITYNFHP